MDLITALRSGKRIRNINTPWDQWFEPSPRCEFHPKHILATDWETEPPKPIVWETKVHGVKLVIPVSDEMSGKKCRITIEILD